MIAKQLLKKGSEHYTNTTNNEHFEHYYTSDRCQPGLSITVYLAPQDTDKIGFSPRSLLCSLWKSPPADCCVWRCVLPKSNLPSGSSVLSFALDHSRPEIQGTSPISTATTSHISLHTVIVQDGEGLKGRGPHSAVGAALSLLFCLPFSSFLLHLSPHSPLSSSSPTHPGLL